MTGAAAPDADHAAVLAAEHGRQQALMSADTAALDRLHVGDALWVHSSGRVDDKAGLLELIGSGRIAFVSLKPSREQVRLYGTTAVLTYEAQLSLRTAQGVSERVNRVCVVWSILAGAWRVVHWQSTAVATH
jgi:hypothetical protein